MPPFESSRWKRRAVVIVFAMLPLFLFFNFFALFSLASAEDGLDAWLRYERLPDARSHHSRIPSSIVALNSTHTSPINVAGQELQKGIASIFGKNCKVSHHGRRDSTSVVIATQEQYEAAFGKLDKPLDLEQDGFWLHNKGRTVEIIGQNERGALYGAFKYLSMLAQADFKPVTYTSNPSAPIRWVNQWDNLDGTIERGYAGASIFFADGVVVKDMKRPAEYARLLASIGINAVVVNNVNSDADILSTDNIDGLGRIADAFRPYGVKLSISLLFSSPTSGVSGSPKLSTYDPLDPDVINWWQDVTDRIYSRIPDFAGYLIKASSEGQPGPETYGRTLADGANLFGNAVKQYGGVAMFRAFVYDKNYDKSNWRADRALAANEAFEPLDGKFDDNVILQIKFGPEDFQVREPTSPLFANLPNTNTAIEVQVSQEYLGQQCHLVYNPPLWKTVLDFDLRADGKETLTRDVVTGKRFNRSLGGFAAVVNVGTNTTWLGSHLAMSNLYTYGRLAWDPVQDPKDTLQDWTRLTFGLDKHVVDTITKMSMDSWPAYEGYTGNLGMQTLVAIYTHFGPDPHDQDFSGAGRWFRADRSSIGMDRTVKNGTRFSGQYPPEVAQRYENLDTTPDNLLLWFHHVNYTQHLKSGETVLQHIYNAHYDGAETVQGFVPMWESLESKIDGERYEEVLFRLYFQAGHALVWRDAICDYFQSVSKIADETNRVLNHPWRIEAEDMKLDGYSVQHVSPFETASNSHAIVTSSKSEQGIASSTIPFDDGIYDLAINYFDMYGGRSDFQVFINDEEVGKWSADSRQWMDGKQAPSVLGHDVSRFLDGHSATRTVFHGVKVAKGDEVKIIGTPDGIEPAPLDFISFLPPGIAD